MNKNLFKIIISLIIISLSYFLFFNNEEKWTEIIKKNKDQIIINTWSDINKKTHFDNKKTNVVVWFTWNYSEKIKEFENWESITWVILDLGDDNFISKTDEKDLKLSNKKNEDLDESFVIDLSENSKSKITLKSPALLTKEQNTFSWVKNLIINNPTKFIPNIKNFPKESKLWKRAPWVDLWYIKKYVYSQDFNWINIENAFLTVTIEEWKITQTIWKIYNSSSFKNKTITPKIPKEKVISKYTKENKNILIDLAIKNAELVFIENKNKELELSWKFDIISWNQAELFSYRIYSSAITWEEILRNSNIFNAQKPIHWKTIYECGKVDKHPGYKCYDEHKVKDVYLWRWGSKKGQPLDHNFIEKISDYLDFTYKTLLDSWIKDLAELDSELNIYVKTYLQLGDSTAFYANPWPMRVWNKVLKKTSIVFLDKGFSNTAHNRGLFLHEFGHYTLDTYVPYLLANHEKEYMNVIHEWFWDIFSCLINNKKYSIWRYCDNKVNVEIIDREIHDAGKIISWVVYDVYKDIVKKEWKEIARKKTLQYLFLIMADQPTSLKTFFEEVKNNVPKGNEQAIEDSFNERWINNSFFNTNLNHWELLKDTSPINICF